MKIREIRLGHDCIGSDVVSCNYLIMQYLLKTDRNLRALGESFLNEYDDYLDEELNGLDSYERIIYKFVGKNDKILGLNYYNNDMIYFNEDSLEVYDKFYVFDINHNDFLGGIYDVRFEDGTMFCD